MIALVHALPLLMFAALALLLFSGLPVAIALAGVGLGFFALGAGLGLVHPADLSLIHLRIWGNLAADEDLIYPAVPALLFMGAALEQSGIAHELLAALSRASRRVPGHLPIAVTLLGVLLAPTAGLVGASVTTLALIALPSLLDQGYGRPYATGVVAAAGTLGIVFPPAILLFFMAQALGVQVPVLFMGMVVPALLLLALQLACHVAVGLRPGAPGRTVPPADEAESWPRLLLALGRSGVLPLLLLGVVFGSIIAGLATPLESGALGAVGALGVAALHGTFSRRFLREVLVRTTVVTGMVFFVVIGATVFSFVFVLLGGPGLVTGGLEGLRLGPWGVLLATMGIVLVLGFFIDWIEILLIFFPILVPLLMRQDFGAWLGAPWRIPAWIGVLLTLNLQSSFITPPFGFSLFFVKGAAPEGVSMGDVYRGIVPFVLVQLVVIALVLAFPLLATWLPDHVLRTPQVLLPNFTGD
ncbi:MAG TPA: TRAP transporter large permease subunit [bacterium]|nr:TRAP transporter large permease subunit [bacterium]